MDDSGEVPPLSPAKEAPKVAEGDPNDIEDEWDIEVTEELDASGIRHKNEFYKLLRRWFRSREYTCILLTKRKHNEILRFCLDIISGADIRSLYLDGNKQAYKWMAKYDAIVVDKAGRGDDRVVEVEHAVLVLRPKKSAVEAQSLQLSAALQPQPTYWERVFSDLYKIHKSDHCKCKGNTLAKRSKQAHDNIPRDLCKLFTDCCLSCISVMKAKKPVAGIKNIVTDGFGVRGQVDLIDFQSMPDGQFKFLLNYIDHGIKKLMSIPLVAKRVSAAAVALLTIFTEQGPPTILQADNGGEFSGSALDHKDRQVFLDYEYVDQIISEVKLIWPECHLVRGSPRHSESNGGVERVNQTVQKKLGAWMKENKSKHWSIGCKIVQWRYNTQEHRTIKDTPYHLTFGQHPRVGISNLPIASEILNSLSTESES